MKLAQDTIHVVAHGIVGRIGEQVHHVTIESTDILINGHIIIVEDHQKVIRVSGGIV